MSQLFWIGLIALKKADRTGGGRHDGLRCDGGLIIVGKDALHRPVCVWLGVCQAVDRLDRQAEQRTHQRAALVSVIRDVDFATRPDASEHRRHTLSFARERHLMKDQARHGLVVAAAKTGDVPSKPLPPGDLDASGLGLLPS